MKQKMSMLFVLLLIAAGLGVLWYPTFSTWLNSRNQTRAIQHYTEAVAQLDKPEIEAQWELAQSYNRKYSAEVTNSLNLQIPPDYGRVLNFSSNGVMGYVQIPVIEVYLPIYHGTAENVLRRGVGHIPETALPTSGEGLHPVLTGHRAMASSSLFNDLDLLQKGDIFLLHVLDQTFAYEVDKITVVEPNDTSELLPVVGEDYVTLVTCTPYAVNSHRLLVRGHHIPYAPDIPVAVREIQRNTVDWQRVIVLAFLVLWALLVIYFTRNKGAPIRIPPVYKKRRRPTVVIFLLILSGLLIVLYPFVSRLMYQSQATSGFETFKQTQETEQYDWILEELRQYNNYLFTGGQKEGLQNPLAFKEPNTALQELGFAEDIIGYIEIQRTNVVLPIYLGASDANMNRGAAHMTWTSVPIGGKNTNTCIIGHRNLALAEMFRNIDKLEVGDVVQIHTPWDTLAYVVAETKIIWPSETEHLEIQPNRDLLTLVSCHPRGSNEQRCLVICERGAQ